MTETSIAYYSNPERIAELEECKTLKHEQGCRVCAHRDMQIICFEERVCSEGHSPLKGKKYCFNFELEG